MCVYVCVCACVCKCVCVCVCVRAFPGTLPSPRTQSDAQQRYILRRRTHVYSWRDRYATTVSATSRGTRLRLSSSMATNARRTK